MAFITQEAINICLETGETKVDGEGVKIKIDQTVSCANIWKAFGLKEIKDKARQSEGRTEAEETFDGLSTCRHIYSIAQKSEMNSGMFTGDETGFLRPAVTLGGASVCIHTGFSFFNFSSATAMCLEILFILPSQRSIGRRYQPLNSGVQSAALPQRCKDMQPGYF